jgi:Mg2+/citrate symporter
VRLQILVLVTFKVLIMMRRLTPLVALVLVPVGFGLLAGTSPVALGPHLAVVTGVLSMPFTYFISNDAF